MARLSYSFPIGYDRPVDYDQPVAPDVLTSTLDAGWPADSQADLATADQTIAQTVSPESQAQLDASDTAANLASGSESTLKVEVAG